jgi:hypothetical protein
VAFISTARAGVLEEDVTPSRNGPERAVVVTAERRLLAGLIDAQLKARAGASWELADVVIKDPKTLRRKVPDVRLKYRGGVAVLLVDPVTDDWLQAARELRSDPKVAILVLTARPSYQLQRRWRAKVGEGGDRVASGMLSLESSVDDIVGVLHASFKRPKDSGYWLETQVDGTKVEVHPTEFYATTDGQKARVLRSKPAVYDTLLVVGEGQEIQPRDRELVGERLKSARESLEAQSNVQLGRIAAELGLFLDTSPL